MGSLTIFLGIGGSWFREFEGSYGQRFLLHGEAGGCNKKSRRGGRLGLCYL
jgi:hypothetical protein